MKVHDFYKKFHFIIKLSFTKFQGAWEGGENSRFLLENSLQYKAEFHEIQGAWEGGENSRFLLENSLHYKAEFHEIPRSL